ncbi:DinB family protein [Brevibacillus sp. SIMBA_040]|uniref:DinB family protein n=1 Tax=unclassified Brevibacillus TaxID=2684853 RepID=UPI0039785F70
MNTVEMLSRFEEVAEQYVKALDGYSAEQFTKKPAADEWSLGQLYNHLIQSAVHMQIMSIEQCASGNGVVGVGKTENGEMIIGAGKLPPIAIKVPDSPQYTPANPESPEEVKPKLLRLIDQVRELEPSVAAISPDQKMPHPALGYLNAAEWYQLISMHFVHHLRQKEKLDAFVQA